MADISVEQYKEAARKAYQAGDVATAKSLIARAKAAAPKPEQAQGESLARSLFQGITFGAGDEIVAGAAAPVRSLLYGGSIGEQYDKALAQERGDLAAGREANSITSTVGEIGGSLAAPLGVLGRVGSAGSMPIRMGKSAAAGGAMAGAYGFNAGEGGANERIAEALDAAKFGAAVGAVAPAIGGVIQKVADERAMAKAIREGAKDAPTSDQLRKAGNALYDEVDQLGVQIKPEAFSGARQQILDALRTKTGFDELPGPGSLTPRAARTMQIMQGAEDAMAGAAGQNPALPFRALDQMRRQAGAAAGNVAEKTDQAAGMEIIKGLDEFVGRMGPQDVVAGDVEQLAPLIGKARAVWSRMSKSQMIDDAIERGKDYRYGSANGIKNQFNTILRNPKLSRNFSDAEKAAMRKVVNGSVPMQLLEIISSGFGQMGQMAAGFGLGGLPGLAAGGALAAGTRKANDAIIDKRAEIVRALIANGRLQQMPKANPQIENISAALTRRAGAAALQQ